MNMLRFASVSGLVVAALLSGCRSVSPAVSASPAGAPQSWPSVQCPTGSQAMLRETLFFGRNRPGGGQVGDAELQSFVDDVVVPRFPDGFTLVNAKGYWRSGDGRIESEPSMLLIVLHPGDAVSTASVAEIAAEYKRRFSQEAVLRERAPSCAAF